MGVPRKKDTRLPRRSAKPPTMKLLDLPGELFTLVVHALVDSMSTKNAFRYRVVSRSFDGSIIDVLCERAARRSFNQLFSDLDHEKLFRARGSTIMSKKALNQSLCLEEHNVIEKVGDVVSYVLAREKSTSPKHEAARRAQYTYLICQSLMALDKEKLRQFLTLEKKPKIGISTTLLPAIAAALGKAAPLQKFVVSYKDLINPGCDLFPNALSAAVSSDQTQVLSWMLGYLKEKVKGRPETDTWNDIRSAARSVGQALRTAIRLLKHGCGKILFDWLDENQAFRKSMGLYFGEQITKDCMRHGNDIFIHRAFAYRQNKFFITHPEMDPRDIQLTPGDQYFLFKHGHPAALRALIRNGQFNPDVYQETQSALGHAMNRSRYDMARVLLQEGVDINGSPRNRPDCSYLVYSTQRGQADHVRFLLMHGADLGPTLTAFKEKPWIVNAKCNYLLEKVKTHGRGFLQHPDIWKEYNEMMEEEVAKTLTKYSFLE